MSGADIVVMALVAIGVVLAVRSLLRDGKKGGCPGCCHGCDGESAAFCRKK